MVSDMVNPPDHPRLCGEHLNGEIRPIETLGSPPPVRGALRAKTITRIKYRITPACAGSTWADWFADRAKSDHPRLCGEHISCSIMIWVKLRITPACAGSTYKPLCCPSHKWDHPRLCGEHSSLISRMRCGYGSPPPVRGALPHTYDTRFNHRITPACAGSTFSRRTEEQINKDHPRLCGEHQLL